MSRLTRDGTAEPVSRDQILRHARGQGNIHFPCSTRLIHTLLYMMAIDYLLASVPTFFAAAMSQHGCRGKRFGVLEMHHHQSMVVAGLHREYRRVLACHRDIYSCENCTGRKPRNCCCCRFPRRWFVPPKHFFWGSGSGSSLPPCCVQVFHFVA